MNADERATLTTVANYQFGAGAGDALFPEDEEIVVIRTSSGRPAQIQTPDERRIVSYGNDGRFTLGIAGGERLLDALPEGAYTVVVGDDSEPFVRDGKNVFAKFVKAAAPEIRPTDEVSVIHERGDLLAVGRAELPATAMLDFETGMAVKVRDGAEK